MKLSVCSLQQLIIILLSVCPPSFFSNLQIVKSQNIEYSIEERIHISQPPAPQLQQHHIPINHQELLKPQQPTQQHGLHQQQHQLLHNPNNQPNQPPPTDQLQHQPTQYLQKHQPPQNQGPYLQKQQIYQQQHDQTNEQHQTIQHQHSYADNMEQILLDHSRQLHYAHAQFEYHRESSHDGSELSEVYVQEYETASHPLSDQEQLAYYQYQQVKHLQSNQRQYVEYFSQNTMYSKQSNDEDHDLILNQQQYHHHHHQHIHIQRPTGYCDSYENPSILLQTESTCRVATLEGAASPNSAQNVPNFSQLTNKPSHNSNVESYPLAVPHYNYENSLLGAIRHYWREVSGLCLASAIFLNWLFVVVKRRFTSSLARAELAVENIQRTTTKSLSKDTNSSSAHDSAFEENTTPVGLDENGETSSAGSSSHDKSSAPTPTNGALSTLTLNVAPVMRQRSSTLKANPIPIPLSPGHNSLSTSLSNSLNNSEFNSRYCSDFESIQRLGRGGFGVVFEAKNKIDDCHYAVKRICLPLEKEARERVMREVRALAKLDHAGIVRYYNAWLETPTDEWLKQHDAQLGIVHFKDGMSFPSTDGIYERNESEQITKGGESYCGRLGESGDNSTGSGLFGSIPFKRRANGYRKFPRNNSSSPSLDIVFEGSGSIRLEAENNTCETSSNNQQESVDIKRKRKKNLCEQNGDNNSDSEDSDFIQFESRGNEKDTTAAKTNNVSSNNGGPSSSDEDELSFSSHLTEPFSSSSSESDDEGSNDEEVLNKFARAAKAAARVKNATIGPLAVDHKNALQHQKELRQMAENLHVEKIYLYIQMQLCRKDTLKDWLKTNCENRDKTILFDLFYQIVDAVEYVHSQDLIHRDLKPSNIFFSLDGTLKIGDFGLCRAKTSSGIGSSLDLQEYVAESELERSFGAVHTEQVGTQLYMSPEQLNGLSYNQKVDIFAMGLILLELLVPFKTQMQRVNVLFKARNNLYSDEFRGEHPKEYELVRSLLSRSPQKRPTATEIKQHELLASAQLSQPVIERIYHRRRTISSNSSTE